MTRAGLIKGLWIAFAAFHIAIIVFIVWYNLFGGDGTDFEIALISAIIGFSVWIVGLILFAFIALIVWDHGKRPMK